MGIFVSFEDWLFSASLNIPGLSSLLIAHLGFSCLPCLHPCHRHHRRRRCRHCHHRYQRHPLIFQLLIDYFLFDRDKNCTNHIFRYLKPSEWHILENPFKANFGSLFRETPSKVNINAIIITTSGTLAAPQAVIGSPSLFITLTWKEHWKLICSSQLL